MSVTFTHIKPQIGSYVHVDKAHLCDDDVVAKIARTINEPGAQLARVFGAYGAKEAA